MEGINTILKLARSQIFQILYTIISFIVTILLPIVGYFQIKASTECVSCINVNFGYFEEIIDQAIIWLIVIGIFITLTRYLIYYFPKFSFKRATFSLLNSILFVIFFITSSALAVLEATYQNQQLYIDLRGVFVLLISFWGLFLFRDIFNIIDFKINEDKYITEFRKEKFRQNQLVKCPKCNYSCKLKWKKCPICKAMLKKVDIS